MTETDKTRRRSYACPPIEEALVELRFVPTQDWDLTIPGKVHERVKASYPGKPRNQQIVQAEIRSHAGLTPSVAVREGISRIQLVDADGRRILSLGPDVLSVNVLRPYPGWDEFRPRVATALEVYAEVSGAKQINRIGVRYINRIAVPSQEVRLAEWFHSGPMAPDGLPTRLVAFFDRAEHVFDDGVKLVLAFGSLDSTPDAPCFLLDVDVVWEGPDPLDLSSAMQMVDELHQREGEAFEAMITDRSREVFDVA